jgi:DNA-binding MarR family transcriptional regulator
LTPIEGPATPYDDPPLIGALLRIPWETVRRRMLEGLHERGFTDLNAAHLAILQYPGPSGLRPSELAERTRMSKQALNYLLGQMERLGYITRRERPQVPGSKRVELTKRGEKVVFAMRAIVSEMETQWERDLGPERFAQLRELLVELQASLPQPGGPSS